MVFGVAFYSFVIGNVQSIITKSQQDTENLVNKLKSLEKFKKKNNLKLSVYIRIKKYLEQNYNDLKWTMDFDNFLPACLNDEILTHIYGDTVNNIIFFKEITKKNFIWSILPFLQTIKVEYGEIIYLERDLAKELYFIKSGSIKIYYKKHRISSISEGDYFGDIEVLFNINREVKARASNDCILLVINKKSLEKVLEEHPDIRNEMLNTAKEKRERYYDIIIQKKLPMPDNTLEVYGIQNVESDEQRYKSIDNKIQIIPLKNNEDSSNTSSSSSSESSSEVNEEPESAPKPKLIVPEPFGINLENIDPTQSSHIRKVNEVIDQKLDIHENFIKNTPLEYDVSEEDVIKILENYNEDMEMLYLLTCKVSKTLAKTLSKTNKLYNKCVEVEQKSLLVEKEQIKMESKVDKLQEFADNQLR